MKNCPNPECEGSEDSLEIVEDERCTRNRCCWVHCDWCGVAGPTAGPSDESAIEAWDRLPRITEENYTALKDEFNRGAALAQQHCPKAPLGHSVFEGIPLLAAVVAQLKAQPTAEQERKWVLRYLSDIACHLRVDEYSEGSRALERAERTIEKGEHWPEGEKT